MAALRGGVDVALVPVWGWGSSLGEGHMDPERAARAIALVAPRVAVPIHWGTFLPYGSRRRDLLTTPAVAFARHVRALAPATRVELLAPGGSLVLPAS
jgi:L-ascorbate metabolism protein UlaG (beta-lactamase superfamily)